MTILFKKEPYVLLFGDIAAFVAALWISIFIRYGQIPTNYLFQIHLKPFSIIFIVWLLVFYAAGLYEKQTSILRNRIPLAIFNAQIVNSVLAAIFFYLSSTLVKISPKSFLLITLVSSFVLVVAWRRMAYRLAAKMRRQVPALIIGSGQEFDEMKKELREMRHYRLRCDTDIDISDIEAREKINQIIKQRVPAVVIVDLKHPAIENILPILFPLFFSEMRFIDFYKVYEDIFDKIPLSLLRASWFFETISSTPHTVYEIIKRVTDIAVSVVFGLLSLALYPFVILAIKIEDGGHIFVRQNRVGRNMKIISIYKFRSMSIDENGVWVGESKNNKVTKVGHFLRRSSIDELPQLWSVFKGELSLIGPRPDVTGLASRLADNIPYYNTRYIIKPGLSGWAQIKQDVIPQSVEETKERLAYDLYYIKNRSFLLDVSIAVKTITTLLARGGR